MYKNKDEFGRLLVSIGKPVDIDMEKILREADREFNEQMERDRKEMRRARANNPNICHCPHCYIIG
jgi:hypothetical protein